MIYDMIPGAPLSDEKTLILGKVKSGARVLEVGAHAGSFTRLLRDKGCTVTAVEADPVAGERLKDVANETVVGDFEKIAQSDRISGPFDVVLFMHVLEHMADPWSVLRKAKSILAADGELLVLVPNIAGWRTRKALFFGGEFEYTETGTLDRTHLRFFTYNSARKLLEDSGYAVVEQSVVDPLPPVERRLRLTPGLGWLARWWKRFAESRYPNLTAEIIFLRARSS